MIYLIGGPPRCGKTTLAKALSKRVGASWISTDMLEVISGRYMTKNQWSISHPYSILRRIHKSNDAFYTSLSSQKIVTLLRKQARATFPAIEMAIACAVADEHDLIIEGYHLEPRLANQVIKKYGKEKIKAIFLIKEDPEKFASDVRKSTTPNDWLLVLTKQEDTFLKVGVMVAALSQRISGEAKKHQLLVCNTDQNFERQMVAAVKYFIE